MASKANAPSPNPLEPINLEGLTLEGVEKMELAALKEALRSVARREGSTCNHNNHGSHGNAHGNTITREEV